MNPTGDVFFLIAALVATFSVGFALGCYLGAQKPAQDTDNSNTEEYEPQTFTITTVTTITDENGNIIDEEETGMTFEA